MAIDIDGVIGRDLTEGDEASAQRGLEVQTVLHGDGLEEAVLGGWRRKKGETGQQAKVGAADRIDGTDTYRVAENRLEDQAQGEALRRETFRLGRA